MPSTPPYPIPSYGFDGLEDQPPSEPVAEQPKPRTQRYGCKDKPGALVTVTVPADAETPAQIAVRYPDEDYREYVFWWHDEPALAASDSDDPAQAGERDV